MAAVLVYVKPSFKNTDGTYEYDLFFSETPEYVWGVDWDVMNPSTCGDLTPEESTYSEIYHLKTTLPLKTAEETSCYSMEYTICRILALSWIDIENLDEYPEHGRMTFHFGDTKEYVEEKIGEYGWSLEK